MWPFFQTATPVPNPRASGPPEMPVPNEARPCPPDRQTGAQPCCESAVPTIDLPLHLRRDYPAVVTIRIETTRHREVPMRTCGCCSPRPMWAAASRRRTARRRCSPRRRSVHVATSCVRGSPGRPSLPGMVIVVPPTSAARRFAGDDEAEMHLLATASACRRMGVGRALVHAAMDHARTAGLSRMLLWTQTSMHAAQRLYASAGFVRVPGRDFSERGRHFLFFAADL